MYLIVGLGNPGKEYENTRHNIGFDVIETLAAQEKIDILEKKHKDLWHSKLIKIGKILKYIIRNFLVIEL